MSTVQLLPTLEAGVTIPTANGGEIHLRQRRLTTWVKVGAYYAIYEAVLDTGAPTCIFTKRAWKPLADIGRIEWITHPPAQSGVGEALPRTTFLGGTYPFRLGRVSLQIVGAAVGDELSPVPALVQCTEDESLPALRLIGLEGVLNGRTLTVSASADGSQWSASLAE